MDGETEQYLVALGDGERKEVMTYSAILEIMEKQHAEEIDNADRYWSFKSIGGHRKDGRTWEVLVKWEDGSESWETLAAIRGQDPVTLANYAKEHDLLETDGWKSLMERVSRDGNHAAPRVYNVSRLGTNQPCAARVSKGPPPHDLRRET